MPFKTTFTCPACNISIPNPKPDDTREFSLSASYVPNSFTGVAKSTVCSQCSSVLVQKLRLTASEVVSPAQTSDQLLHSKFLEVLELLGFTPNP